MTPKKALFFLMVAFTINMTMGQNTNARKNQVTTYADALARTKLEKFESDHAYANMHKDSLRRKHALRIAKIGAIIDTLKISDKKRKRLQNELRKNPFSERLIRMVDLAGGVEF